MSDLLPDPTRSPASEPASSPPGLQDAATSPAHPDDYMRPGWATTEFWVTAGTLLANVVGVLALVLRLSPETAAQIHNNVASIVGAVSVIAINGFILWKYLHSRQEVKVEAVKAAGNLAIANSVATGNASLLNAGYGGRTEAIFPSGPVLLPRQPTRAQP